MAREVYTVGGSTEGEKSVRLRVRGKSEKDFQELGLRRDLTRF